jgi:hypothetical protein
MKVIKTTHNGYIVLHNDLEKFITYISGVYYWQDGGALTEDEEVQLTKAIHWWLVNVD